MPASARHLYLHLCLHLHLSIRENLRPRVSPFAPRPGSYASTYVCTPAYPCHRTAPAVRVRLQFAPTTAPSVLHLRASNACTCTCTCPTPQASAAAKKTPDHGRNQHRATPAGTCLPLPPQGSSPTPSGRDHCQIPASGSAAGRQASLFHVKHPTSAPSRDVPVQQTRTALPAKAGAVDVSRETNAGQRCGRRVTTPGRVPTGRGCDSGPAWTRNQW